MPFAPLSIRIAGTGHALPDTVRTSDQIDRDLGLPVGETQRLSGVTSRHVCQGESQIDLAIAASQAAIEDAGIDIGDIDLVIGASGLPYQALPTTAPLIMRQLGLSDGSAEAHDVNATCLSFVSALNVAASRISLGQAHVALVVSSEVASKALPWDDQPEIAALFGDGAGAAIVTASAQPGIRAHLMRTYPSGYEASSIVSGGTRMDVHTDPEAFARNAVFRMDGAALFKLTHRHFPGFVSELLQTAGWHENDVDLIVPHQASPLALEHMIRATGFDPSRVVTTAQQLGNQVAASIPVALDMARRDGRARAGSKLLLLGTSAGVSFGGMAIEV